MIADFAPAHLDLAAALFVVVFNGGPWFDAWTEDSARKRLEDLLGTPGSGGVVLFDEERLLGFALGHSEQWFVGRHFVL